MNNLVRNKFKTTRTTILEQKITKNIRILHKLRYIYSKNLRKVFVFMEVCQDFRSWQRGHCNFYGKKIAKFQNFNFQK